MTPRQIRAQCRRIRESDKPFHALADAYGIQVRPWDDAGAYENAGGYVSNGPTYCCDPFGRIIFAEDSEKEWSPEDVFHELVHVLMALPFHQPNGIDKIDEERILMQVERTIAQRCLPQRLLDAVYEYQAQTVVCMTTTGDRDFLKMPALGSFKNLGHYPLWRDGYLIARMVGVITNDRWPTFEWPDWPAMGEVAWRYLTRTQGEKNRSVRGS